MYWKTKDVEVLLHSTMSTCPHVGARCYPPCVGVTRGDNVSRYAMKNMIYIMMMMITMFTDGNPKAPLIFLLVASTKAHHIQATQSMGDGKLLSP
jgi:hypothetical protein